MYCTIIIIIINWFFISVDVIFKKGFELILFTFHYSLLMFDFFFIGVCYLFESKK